MSGLLTECEVAERYTRKSEVDRVEGVSFSNIQSLLSVRRSPPSFSPPAGAASWSSSLSDGSSRPCRRRLARARPPSVSPPSDAVSPRRQSALIDRAGADSPGHVLRRSPRRPQPAQCHPRERGYQRALRREEPTPRRSGPTRRAPPRRPAGPRQPARGSPPGGPGPSSHRTCMVARASRVVRTRSTASDDAQSSHDRRLI